jgi:hypothetical protein
MAKTTTFEHSGKIYEVRAIPTLNGWMVRIFVEGIPANRFTYSVDSEVYQDGLPTECQKIWWPAHGNSGA